jgi:aspartyl/asparaginyl-tRNA synthetase
MIEPEMAFADLDDDADLAEASSSTSSRGADERGEDLPSSPSASTRGCWPASSTFVSRSSSA